MATQTDIQPLLDATQNQLGFTMSTSDSLDTKALAVLGFNIAIIIFALQSELHNPWWLLCLLFLAYSVSTGYAIRAMWPSDYKGAVVDITEHPQYLTLNDQELRLQLLSDTQDAIAANTRQNTQKAGRCILAIKLSLVGLLLLFGCIL